MQTGEAVSRCRGWVRPAAAQDVVRASDPRVVRVLEMIGSRRVEGQRERVGHGCGLDESGGGIIAIWVASRPCFRLGRARNPVVIPSNKLSASSSVRALRRYEQA